MVPVSKFLRRWGAVLIFLVMWLASMGFHYHYARVAAHEEAEQHHVVYTESEFRHAWFRDIFENHQSEYAQLFFQGLLVVGFAHALFRKSVEDLEEIKDTQKRMLKMWADACEVRDG